VGWDFETSKGEEGGREVDEGDGFNDDLAGLERGKGLEFFRDADDEGDVDAGLFEVAFAAR
jgi:hypothetical protein